MKIFSFLNLICINVFPACVHLYPINACALESQERVSDLWELELHVVVRPSGDSSGNLTGSSVGTTCALNREPSFQPRNQLL